MNAEKSPESKPRPGDRVRVVDGTFVGMEGVVVPPETPFTLADALAMELTHPKLRVPRPAALPDGYVCVVLNIFGRDVPMDLGRSQVERIAPPAV